VNGRAMIAVYALALVGLGLGAAQIAIAPSHALFAYTGAFLFVATMAVGALLFVMIAHTARARWFVVLRRTTSAIAATIPLLLVLFLPIAFGVETLYPWARPPASLGDPELVQMVVHQRPWMNTPLFVVRSYVYMLAWTAIALVLRQAAIHNDRRPSEDDVRRERFVSAAGIPVMALTITFAAFDWMMPLSPKWTSDVLGILLFAGCLAGSVGATCVIAWSAWKAGHLPDEIRADHFHAIGRVLLVGVIFWTYISFIQFMLVWIADIPREVGFFQARVTKGWAVVSVLLVVVHFVVPFFLLLSRPLKRAPGALAAVGAWVVAAHALDMYWQCVPPAGDGPRVLDFAWFVALGATFVAVGVWRFRAALTIPIHDPALGEALRYESS
jgi:hypothetical protein